MSAELIPIQPPRVHAANGVVHIQDLVSGDPDLHAMVSSSLNPEQVVQHALSTGARALAVASASIDTKTVEDSFEQLMDRLTIQVDGAGGVMASATGDLLNHPTTGLIASLQAWKADFDQALDATFNPDRGSSAFGQLGQILNAAGETQLTATRRMLNPDADDSPMNRVLSSLKEQVATVLDAVARLSDKVAGDAAAQVAVTQAMERSAVKGMDYEDMVLKVVTGLAAERGDVADGTGRTAGQSGSLVGDIIVEVDPSTMSGAAGCYTIEVKDRKLTVRAILAELAEAAANRNARAAIAVFSKPEHCPLPDPFTIFENRAIVLYDKGDPDSAALRLACAWARWIVQRETQPGQDQIDIDAIRDLLEVGRRILAHRANVRRAHSGAINKIKEAAEQVDEMHDEFAEVMAKIEHALR